MRKRERERGGEKDGGREKEKEEGGREKEKEDREMLNMVSFYKGMTGALAPFSFLVMISLTQ